ncbi:MAG: hypothetical protein NDJ90_08955 [Oligoflexia bacterium]|nr:hypothetical protein [Oligoflexia bacterium]
MKNVKSVILALSLLVMMTAASGCGSSTEVMISSKAVSFTDATGRVGADALSVGFTLGDGPSIALVDATDFKLCVRRIKLFDEDGKAVKKDDETGLNGEKDPDDISFAPGLINIQNGVAQDWGVANVPAGFQLTKMTVKVHRDEGLCGVPYSVKFNDVTQTEDVEFKFRFSPAIDLDDDTGAIALSLDAVVSALRNAASLGENNMKSYIEGVEGSAYRR